MARNHTATMLSLVFICLVGTVLSTDVELSVKFSTLPRHEFIKYFNSQNFSWTMAHYDHLEGKHLGCAIVGDNELPYVNHAPELFDGFPQNFDAREAWPQCESIKKVYSQLDCGSCWTFGTAGTVSDRMCIHKNEQVILSEQDLQCCTNCYETTVCGGGDPKRAFEFWVTQGLVTEECKPYDVPSLLNGACERACKSNGVSYDQDKRRGQSMYSVLPDLNQIKAEIAQNGPIQASFQVFEDFLNYNGGIYEYKFGLSKGFHSVRVIGYGQENGVDYWLTSNSWGEKWGEQGVFKMKAFQGNDIRFEDRLCTGLP